MIVPPVALDQGDLFWRFNPQPGNLWIVREHGRWTITNNEGGGYYVLWYCDRIAAQGSLSMINSRLETLRVVPR